ncbi:MAG: tyrosine-type recombinase/integrase, partial [Sutterella wadsworthensis]
LEQVDHVRHTITVRGKGNKERRVAVADAVWERLAVWLEARAGDPCPNVFLAVRRYGRISTGHSITSSAVYQILKTRSSQSGVEDFSPHDLRRTFATRLLGAGTDINLVRKAMGHASVLTTQRYDKREDEEVEEATRKILI